MDSSDERLSRLPRLAVHLIPTRLAALVQRFVSWKGPKSPTRLRLLLLLVGCCLLIQLYRVSSDDPHQNEQEAWNDVNADLRELSV